MGTPLLINFGAVVELVLDEAVDSLDSGKGALKVELNCTLT
jgi:hypothetical protein